MPQVNGIRLPVQASEGKLVGTGNLSTAYLWHQGREAGNLRLLAFCLPIYLHHIASGAMELG